MPDPSIPQLQSFVQRQAGDSANVAFTRHALSRMRERGVTRAMVMETLRLGVIRTQPEPDIRHPGVKCRMERVVSGVEVGAVVHVDHPQPGLIVVTVIDLGD